MRRIVAIAGSLALHVAIGALLISYERTDAPPVTTQVPALEIVEVAIVSELATPASAQATGGGGGTPAGAPSAATEPAAMPTTKAVRSAPRRPRDVTRSLSQIAHAGASEAAGGDGGSGGGLGGGHGRGLGTGIGDGIGPGASELPPPPPPPPAPVKVSKARPAKLIYPTRERDAEAGELFVARVIVDDDGYVAGARIVSGPGGPRGDDAASLIWKFRYAPALDDDGRPIRSTVDQKFLVQ